MEVTRQQRREDPYKCCECKMVRVPVAILGNDKGNQVEICGPCLVKSINMMKDLR